MNTRLLAALPVKSFDIAKKRLSDLLVSSQRARLGEEMATRTARASISAGAEVAVVTGDEEVARWATRLGLEVIPEPAEGGLNQAAAEALRAARQRGAAWCIVHADLPVIGPDDLRAVFRPVMQDGVVLAPSINGGTNLLAGDVDAFEFSYGMGSFARHLRRAAHLRRRVVIRTGSALDLDTPEDLQRAVRLRDGRWLSDYLRPPAMEA